LLDRSFDLERETIAADRQHGCHCASFAIHDVRVARFEVALDLGRIEFHGDGLVIEATEPSTFALTPHVGVTSESAFVDGPVVFSDGDVDFILVEPDTALLLGVELSYWFSPKFAGVLGLSYATADARYIENNDLRRDVGFDTLRIQPGVMATVAGGDKFALDVGGGLTLYRHSIDGLVWNDRRVDPTEVHE
jgi:hypothetical protein